MLKSMTINKTVWQFVSMIWHFEWENDNVNKPTWQSNYLFNIIQNWMTMFKYYEMVKQSLKNIFHPIITF